MILTKIELYNFKSYEGFHEFCFEKVNLISGNNGVGKSTLIKDSLKFGLYGNSDKPMKDLPTRGVAKSCYVTVYFTIGNDKYCIKRSFPTALEVIKNSEEVEMKSASQKQAYLNELLGNIDFFRKFRMIDIREGINILELSEVNLKKTLFTFDDKGLDKVRASLLSEKRNREIYNKEKAVLYKHAPSEKRLSILETSLVSMSEELAEYNKQLGDIRRDIQSINTKKVRKETEKAQIKGQIAHIRKQIFCPTCKQNIDEEHKKTLLKELNSKLPDDNIAIGDYEEKIKVLRELESYLNSFVTKINTRKSSISRLVTRLKGRLEQKEFIYDSKDIIIAKTAIDKFDTFGSFCIQAWVKKLEPIINNVINNINFSVRFDINSKGKLKVILIKDEKEYDYKDLSEGQKLILGISFKLALLLQENKDGLIIADEGFSSLDSNNLTTIFKLFESLPFQLLSVVHRAPEIENVNSIHLGE